MIKKGALTWKRFYEHERDLESKMIDARITEFLKKDDPDPLEVVKKGGILSFPHTILKGSLDPIIRICKAIINSGKEEVLAIAVVHYGNHGPSDEFSLDTFKYVMKRIKEQLGVEYPKVKCIYPPLEKDKPYDTLEERLARHNEEMDMVKEMIGSSTAVVITGDLCHYGEIYNKTIEGDRSAIFNAMDSWIQEGLRRLYKKNDLLDYLNYTMESMNDQRVPAIIARNLLGDDLKYKIFGKNFTEYTELLEEETPHYVASYFYGVWNNGTIS